MKTVFQPCQNVKVGIFRWCFNTLPIFALRIWQRSSKFINIEKYLALNVNWWAKVIEGRLIDILKHNNQSMKKCSLVYGIRITVYLLQWSIYSQGKACLITTIIKIICLAWESFWNLNASSNFFPLRISMSKKPMPKIFSC